MLVAGGVHPYVLRRRQIALSRTKPVGGGLAPALLLAMVLIVGFAYGLREVDRRLAPIDLPAPAEARPSDTAAHQLTA
ncbi:MAG: hypothetical protein WC866_04515 [Patescibacteria group bacterium]